jgi:hypothetical protein
MEESVILSHMNLMKDVADRKANSQPKAVNVKVEDFLPKQNDKTAKKI